MKWSDSLSKYKIQNKIFNYNQETNKSVLAFTLDIKMFTEEETLFSNLFFMNLILLVIFPVSLTLYNKRTLIKDHSICLYKSIFNTD